MDFLKLNSEFQNLQKQLEESMTLQKKIKQLVKNLEKEINKLEQKRSTETDILNKAIIEYKIEFLKNQKTDLETIMTVKES